MRSMLIVTGTGRCGTATMARLLGGYHEFRVEYLIEKYLRHLDPTRPALQTRDERLAPVLDILQGVDHRTFVDVSNLHIHFLDVFPLLDPGARVILVVRDARDFIRSAVARGWHERQEYGIVPQRDDPWFSAWPDLAPPERAAWIWQYRNGLALKKLEAYPDDRTMVVRIEDVSRRETLDDLERFTGRPLADRDAAGLRFNAGAPGVGVPDDNLQAGFTSERARLLCKELMVTFGYAGGSR